MQLWATVECCQHNYIPTTIYIFCDMCVLFNPRSGLCGGAQKKIELEREKMKWRPDTNHVKPHVLHPNFECKSDWLFNNKAVWLAFSLIYLTEHIDFQFPLFNEQRWEWWPKSFVGQSKSIDFPKLEGLKPELEQRIEASALIRPDDLVILPLQATEKCHIPNFAQTLQTN